MKIEYNGHEIEAESADWTYAKPVDDTPIKPMLLEFQGSLPVPEGIQEFMDWRNRMTEEMVQAIGIPVGFRTSLHMEPAADYVYPGGLNLEHFLKLWIPPKRPRWVQVKFPRSKKKRIRKKWAKDQRNYMWWPIEPFVHLRGA